LDNEDRANRPSTSSTRRVNGMWTAKDHLTTASLASLVIFLGAVACVFDSIGANATAADTRRFEPIKTSLIGASTRRELVDIEIVGSAKSGIEANASKSDRAVRLRLERAFIANFLIDKPRGSSLLSLIVDQRTGLPSAILSGASQQDRRSQGNPEIPGIAYEEAVARQIILNLDSNVSDDTFANYFAEATRCAAESGNSALREIKQEKSVGTSPCARSAYPDGRKWLVRATDGSPAIIECHGFNRPTTTHCSTRFVFQRFSVKLGFHESKLHQWFDVVEFGRKFLSSKQVVP